MPDNFNQSLRLGGMPATAADSIADPGEVEPQQGVDLSLYPLVLLTWKEPDIDEVKRWLEEEFGT